MKNKKKYTIKFTSYHFRKICREVVNVNFRLSLLLIDIISRSKKLYKPPKEEYWPLKPTKEVTLYKKPSKRKITFGFSKHKELKKNFIKKFITKDKIENYYPTIIYLDKIALDHYLYNIKNIINNKKKDEFFIIVYKDKNLNEKGFIFYLTKSQIKKIKKAKVKDRVVFPTLLNFSINQTLKTYKEVITINSKIYNYLKKGKTNSPPKLLAISDKPYNQEEILSNIENLKNLEEKDLIEFSDEEKDLIEFSDEEKPKPKPKPKAKKYKILNEDIIQSNTKTTTNGKNILKNILNYPETKRLLGISLTIDIKNKIKNLDAEASFGLASIISSLLTANRGKMSVYSISRNQLKEIIEGFITTLSILLNPTQKY